MNIKSAAFVLAATFLFSSSTAKADELEVGRRMMASKDLEGAAQFFNSYAVKNPGDKKNSPEALAMAGRILDVLADSLTGQAEKGCYWGKGGGSPECMQRFVGQYNARFGDGAFRYEHAITYIPYTGAHYRRIVSEYPKSSFVSEAEFYLLLRQLVGHPDTVLPKIKAFISKHPKGEWNRKGLLLWARANEDTWYVHRKWSWVLFNDKVSIEDLIIRAEPYRQEALRTYEKLKRDSKTFEGQAAAREYEILKENGEDGVTYSIVNDSSPGTLSTWGISQPAAPASTPYHGAKPSQLAPAGEAEPSTPAAPEAKPSPQIRSAPPSDDFAPPLPPPKAPQKREVKKPPTRWN